MKDNETSTINKEVNFSFKKTKEKIFEYTNNNKLINIKHIFFFQLLFFY